MSEPVIAWFRIDGERDYALTYAQAWRLAWDLIGLCVDSKQRERDSAPAEDGGPPREETETSAA